MTLSSLISELELVIKHQPGRHDQQRHAGSRTVSASITLPDNRSVRSAFSKSGKYLQPGDIREVALLSEDEFRQIDGINPGDVAYYSNGKLVVNELRLEMSPNPEQVVSHEIGHAIMDRLVADAGEERLVTFWDKFSHSLSGSQQHSPSEGLAELYAIRVADEPRFVRIAGDAGLREFDELLQSSQVVE